MSKTSFLLAFCILLLISVSGCKTKEKMLYFQGENTDSVSLNYTTVLQADDIVSIIVTAENPESALQFNMPTQGVVQSQNNGYTVGNPARLGYLIDKEGYINFPVLGKLKLGGLERTEATSYLEQEISKYVNSPVVQLQIENFKVTVLGDVSRPGTFKIPNERITLLEAIGLAGDLRLTGMRKSVLVIRENDGKRIEYRLDLTSKELFSSPAYYLKQNDVIYVEPNMAARSQSTFFRTTGSIFIAIAGVIVSTLSVLTR